MIGPVVQWIVRRSPEPKIQVRFPAGLQSSTSIFFRMEEYFAYLIKSELHDYFYWGHLRDLDFEQRQHNAGMTTSMKPDIPFLVENLCISHVSWWKNC